MILDFTEIKDAEIENAIKRLQCMMVYKADEDDYEAIDLAIMALQKQLGIPPVFLKEKTQNHMNAGVKAPYCPVCGECLLDEHNDCFLYCPTCGLKINWTGEVEE